MDVRAGPWIRLSAKELMLSNCGAGEDSWESLGQQDQTSQSQRKSTLNIHWKEWCWSWNFNTLATWCELTHFKRPWFWERLRAGGEGDNRGWDGWMASLTQWTWVSVDSRSWWWTGKPGVLHSMALHVVGQDWATELNWADECLLYARHHWKKHTFHCQKSASPLRTGSWNSTELIQAGLHLWAG